MSGRPALQKWLETSLTPYSFPKWAGELVMSVVPSSQTSCLDRFQTGRLAEVRQGQSEGGAPPGGRIGHLFFQAE